MMYIIRLSDKDLTTLNDSTEYKREPKAYHWHVGEKRPYTSGGHAFEDVVEIYADGHELEYVRKAHTNLPDVPTARSLTWRGENAQFIYDHLSALGSIGVSETAHFRESL